MTTLRTEVPRALKPLLAPARYKAAYGGRASAKSHFFGERVIVRCVEAPTRIVCIREVQNSIKDSVQQLLLDKIKMLGVGYMFDTVRDEIRGSNGSLIIFRGMNDQNDEAIKSLEGYDVAWVEEAQTLSQGSLDKLRPTIRKANSELWFSWNPRHKSDPVDVFFRQRPPTNAIVVSVSWRDNPWFPQDLLAEMQEDREKDPAKAAHVWEGAYEAAPGGSYYGVEIADIEAQRRVGDVLADPSLPVHTAWDLGAGGNMATWFFQVADGQFRWLGFHEYEVAGLPHAAGILKAKQAANGWVYGTHLWPHDGTATEIGSGDRRCDIMEKLGFRVEVLPKAQVADGIEAVRRVLKMSRFDRDGTEKGFDHLRGYVRKFDKVHKRFIETPDKNGHDHAADAMRTAAMGRDKLSNTVDASQAAEVVADMNLSWVI